MVSDFSLESSRVAAGHPEGFFEAFANIYLNFTDTIRSRYLNQTPTEAMLDFPNVNDGVRGMLFIETVLKSAKNDQKWTKILTHK